MGRTPDLAITQHSMKICIAVPSFVGGGAERVAVNLVNHYASIGYKVTMVCLTESGPYRALVNEGVEVVCVHSRARYALVTLGRTVERLEPDVVLSALSGTNILLGLYGYLGRRYRLVFREANTMDSLDRLPLYSRFIYKLLMRAAYKKADCVIANSSDTAQGLIEHGIASGEKVTVIGNPVLPPDFQQLSSATIVHPWQKNTRYKTILSVGRLHRQKNQAMLIEAFAGAQSHVDNLRLIVLGEGGERKSLQMLADRLGVGKFVDIVNFQQNPYPYYKNAALFVLTSDWEGFGNVLVEALACGTPVISTDCPGGPREILGWGKYGVLVPCGDAEALAVCILEMIQAELSPEKKQLLVDRANEFSVVAVAKKYLRVMTQ